MYIGLSVIHNKNNMSSNKFCCVSLDSNVGVALSNCRSFGAFVGELVCSQDKQIQCLSRTEKCWISSYRSSSAKELQKWQPQVFKTCWALWTKKYFSCTELNAIERRGFLAQLQLLPRCMEEVKHYKGQVLILLHVLLEFLPFFLSLMLKYAHNNNKWQPLAEKWSL